MARVCPAPLVEVNTVGPWSVLIQRLRLRNPLNLGNPGTKISAILRSRERRLVRTAARDNVAVVVPMVVRRDWPGRVAVQILRIAPGTLDAWDGLPAACKAVVDGVADAFGVRDDDPRWVWLPPRQEKRGKGRYAVEIRIELVSEESREQWKREADASYEKAERAFWGK